MRNMEEPPDLAFGRMTCTNSVVVLYTFYAVRLEISSDPLLIHSLCYFL